MPISDDDWTIHSLNIHGVFLELWCEKTINNDPNWRVKSVHEAVEFPPPQGPVRGKESHLDIRAERWTNYGLLTLLVECKKANPEFVNWIFFPSQSTPKTNALIFSEIIITDISESNAGWSGAPILRREFPFKNIPFTNEARETRGAYQAYKKNDKTRTANVAITDAAYQAALGTQSVLYDQIKMVQEGSCSTSSRRPSWFQQMFLPVVLTTANIFTCESNPSDVDPKTGEIYPYDKAHLIPHDCLLFEYTLPRHLQLLPEYFQNDDLLSRLIREMKIDALKKRIDPTRMYILVVNSGHFSAFLKEIDRITLSLLNAL